MTKRIASDAEVLAQSPAARERARQLRQHTPHAKTAYFDRAVRRIVVVLTNGASLVVPVGLVPVLRAASDKDLAEVVVGPAGVGLRWERLDADLTVASLARLALGAQVLLRAAGAAGGAVRTSAKARAARLNGLRGGRPPKTSGKSAV